MLYNKVLKTDCKDTAFFAIYKSAKGALGKSPILGVSLASLGNKRYLCSGLEFY